MDDVFRAIADPTRRKLLDALLEVDGRSLTALCATLPMTRFGVMKHLRVLEEAGLVVTRRRGREKLHFLDPEPIRRLQEGWLSRYASRTPDVPDTPDPSEQAAGESVFQTYVAATQGRLWAAIADLPEAVNLQVDPPRRLVQRLADPGDVGAERASWITWEIEAVGQASRLTVSLARPPDGGGREVPDWRALLVRLGVRLEGTA